MAEVRVRVLRDDERGWLRDLLVERWGAPIAAGRGEVRDASVLPALVAEAGEQRVGVATYETRGPDDVELVTLDSLVEGAGVGRALVDAVARAAIELGARNLLVMTTNDNLRALRFYQRVGFELHELRVGEVARARRTKPSIPLVGNDGIPIRDEIDLVLPLARW